MAAIDYRIESGGPPAAADAERAVLGAILLDSVQYFDAAELVVPDDFHLESHRRIYGRIREMMEAQLPVDLVTVVEELRNQQQLEAIGGAAYLAGLTEGLPQRPSVRHYVKIVHDKAILRRLIALSQVSISKAYEQSETVEEILTQAESAVLELTEDSVSRDFVSITDIVKNSFGSIDALYDRGQRVTGLETHFSDFDNLTSGLQKSDLVIIAGRPSMGKTAFALNIAENAAVYDSKVVGIFSLEMSCDALLLRLLCSHARVDSHKLRTGFLARDDYHKLVEALGRLVDAPIFIDDTPGITIGEMRAKARRLRHQQKRLDLIIVDYLQLMSGGTPGGKTRYENRTQEVSAISRGLKMLAKELEVPVVALSQLSRAPESRGGDHRPQLSDLRESGSIEQDADVVAFIFREEVYNSTPENEGLAELIIAKQRNGPTGKIDLAFMKRYTCFGTLDKGSGYNELGGGEGPKGLGDGGGPDKLGDGR